MNHVHCSICGHAATFVVINRRKEREPLCEQHMLWYLDNTEPRFMPEFDRIKACCGAVMRDRTDTPSPYQLYRRTVSKNYYHRNKDAVLARKQQRREAFINIVLATSLQ